MKTVAVITGLVIVMSGIVYNLYNNEEVTALNTPSNATTTVETVEVDALEKRVADAQAEAMASIEERANAMRDEFIENELKKVETEVLKEVQKELDNRVIDLEKSTGAYWKRKENVVALIKATFPEDPYTAVEVAMRETGIKMVQSRHVYTASNAPKGFEPGDREQSYCIFQIHEPVHKETIKRHGLEDYRTNVESCVKMARIVYDQRGFNPWSVYKDILAMR